MSITVYVRCTLDPRLCCTVRLPAGVDDPHQPSPSLCVQDLREAIARALRLSGEQRLSFAIFHDFSFLVDPLRTLRSVGVRDGVTVDLAPPRLLSLLLPEACFAPLVEQRLCNADYNNNGSSACKALLGAEPTDSNNNSNNNNNNNHSNNNNDNCDNNGADDNNRIFPLPKGLGFGGLPLDAALANAHLHDLLAPSSSLSPPSPSSPSPSSPSPSSSSSSVSLSLTWPKVVALSVLPNLVLIGGWFLALQHLKEHKTFDQISQESGDAAAQGFLQALAKDDYKVCREIVKKIITGWVDEVNPWRSGVSVPPLLLQLPPSTR